MKAWIIYDSRYLVNQDDASVYEAFTQQDGWNLKSVTRERNLCWPDGIIVETKVALKAKGVEVE